MKTELVFGIYRCSFRIQDCANEIITWIQTGKSLRYLTCLNANSYVISKKNSNFRNALLRSDWIVPDGIGILLALLLHKGKIENRVTGSDIFKQVNTKLNDINGSVFLLGSTKQNLKKIVRNLKKDHPNIKIAGVYSPPFKSSFTDKDTDKMVTKINEYPVDVLWVGMTSPKQDLIISKCCSQLNVKFAAGVGAVFDFYSGNIARAPLFMQMLGLEWLHRLIKSPKRMFKRNILSGSLFLYDVVKYKLKISCNTMSK